MMPKVPIAISASRKVDDARVLASSILAGCTEAIPDTADRVDQRIGLLVVDLATHAPDIDVDDVGRGIEMQVPDMLQQHRARHHAAFISHQIFEQLKFLRQQHQLLAAPARGTRDQVDREIADAQDGFLGDRLAAAEQRLQPRQQLDEGERLDQVIVAAGTQAAHAIVDLAERADDEEGRGDAVIAQLAHHREAVDIGQHAVDRDHAIVMRRRAVQRLAARCREVDQIAAGRELLGELAGGFRIVLDDENAAVTSRHELSRKDCLSRGSPPAYGIGEASAPVAIITMMWAPDLVVAGVSADIDPLRSIRRPHLSIAAIVAVVVIGRAKEEGEAAMMEAVVEVREVRPERAMPKVRPGEARGAKSGTSESGPRADSGKMRATHSAGAHAAATPSAAHAAMHAASHATVHAAATSHAATAMAAASATTTPAASGEGRRRKRKRNGERARDQRFCKLVVHPSSPLSSREH